MDEVISQDEAARRLGLSVRSLERHRVAGTGPKFIKLGRLVRYRPKDISSWIEAGLRTSTSDPGPGTGRG
jgi:predicted DNA-binding transcriptional regulator AlpA